jgi:15-cis-phytoene synthase
MLYKEFIADVALCQSIHRTYGKSFYAGTLFLSKPQRQATHILYAFFRFPDEYVDTYFSTEKDIALQKLEAWQAAWETLYHQNDTALAGALGDTELAILRATKYVFDTYKIPYTYSTAFLTAMITDTSKDRYHTYAELEQYMYGSASVVGLMMTHIICADDPLFITDSVHTEKLLQKADALGKAFQMTNFLRDIDEDMSIRGRIYIPKEDMDRFGVTETDITNKQMCCINEIRNC